MSWVASENFHLTLKFLGGVDESRVPDVTDALASEATRSFGRVAVREATLMRSDLSPRGARYTPLASAPLSG